MMMCMATMMMWGMVIMMHVIGMIHVILMIMLFTIIIQINPSQWKRDSKVTYTITYTPIGYKDFRFISIYGFVYIIPKMMSPRPTLDLVIDV